MTNSIIIACVALSVGFVCGCWFVAKIVGEIVGRVLENLEAERASNSLLDKMAIEHVPGVGARAVFRSDKAESEEDETARAFEAALRTVPEESEL